MSGERNRARERLIRLATADDPATAQIWRDALHEAGIQALLKNADPLTALSGGAVLSIEVWVLEGDAAAAAALLDAEPAARAHHHEAGWRHCLPHRHPRRRPSADKGDRDPPGKP